MKLVIAEKPSVAKTIANVIGATKHNDGYLSGNGYAVSWCFGHLAELAQAESYNESYGKWKYEDLPIIPDAWQYAVSEDKRKQFEVITSLMRDESITEVINACDAGREGELIFRTVFNLSGCKKPMKRLWISSMEDTAIRTALTIFVRAVNMIIFISLLFAEARRIGLSVSMRQGCFPFCITGRSMSAELYRLLLR